MKNLKKIKLLYKSQEHTWQGHSIIWLQVYALFYFVYVRDALKYPPEKGGGSA